MQSTHQKMLVWYIKNFHYNINVQCPKTLVTVHLVINQEYKKNMDTPSAYTTNCYPIIPFPGLFLDFLYATLEGQSDRWVQRRGWSPCWGQGICWPTSCHRRFAHDLRLCRLDHMGIGRRQQNMTMECQLAHPPNTLGINPFWNGPQYGNQISSSCLSSNDSFSMFWQFPIRLKYIHTTFLEYGPMSIGWSCILIFPWRQKDLQIWMPISHLIVATARAIDCSSYGTNFHSGRKT